VHGHEPPAVERLDPIPVEARGVARLGPELEEPLRGHAVATALVDRLVADTPQDGAERVRHVGVARAGDRDVVQEAAAAGLEPPQQPPAARVVDPHEAGRTAGDVYAPVRGVDADGRRAAVGAARQPDLRLPAPEPAAEERAVTGRRDVEVLAPVEADALGEGLLVAREGVERRALGVSGGGRQNHRRQSQDQCDPHSHLY
jgi:hypothetical protein